MIRIALSKRRVLVPLFAVAIIASPWLSRRLPVWFPEFAANITAWNTISHLADPPSALRSLPVRVRQVPGAKGLAILMSGNAGWWAIDDTIVDELAQDGWNVAGVNSLSMFGIWGGTRTPGQVAQNLESIVATLDPTDAPVVLLGYSFGADTLAVSFHALPPALRSRIAKVVLIAPSRHADFSIGVGLFASPFYSFSRDVAAAMRAMPLDRLVCLSGRDAPAAENPCTDPAVAAAKIVFLPGAHHFDGKYEVLSRTISAFIERSRPASRI